MTDEMTEPDRIREDIERTRGELGDDVDALAEKVRPSSIVNRQMGKVRSAVDDVRERVMGVADDAGEAIGRTPQMVREQTQGHPLAVGLIAFGVGLIASSLIPATRKEQELASTLKDKAEPLTDELASTARRAAENLREPAMEAADAVKATAADAVDDVKEAGGMAMDDVKGSASESARNLRGTQSPSSTTTPTTPTTTGTTSPTSRPTTSGGI
jgi:ElaB/YqjD/DUF883 family membrane-anchored ribosome-binding protein